MIGNAGRLKPGLRTKGAVTQPLMTMAPAMELPVTICVVCYGEYDALAERFLSTLYRCTVPSLFSLRAGLNEVEPATHQLFAEYAAQFQNIETFVEPRNIFKDPLMRRLFYARPITTRWTICCDDDVHFTHPDWLQRLALRIEAKPEVAMWGMPHTLWRRDQFIIDWIRAAKWYRGLPCLRGVDPEGNEATKFCFAAGGFWATRTDVLQQLDWPDPRLIQANEDFLLGEALRQNEFQIGSFYHGIIMHDAPRRNPDAAQVRELQV